jgi:hypothetical protein
LEKIAYDSPENLSSGLANMMIEYHRSHEVIYPFDNRQQRYFSSYTSFWFNPRSSQKKNQSIDGGGISLVNLS